MLPAPWRWETINTLKQTYIDPTDHIYKPMFFPGLVGAVCDLVFIFSQLILRHPGRCFWKHKISVARLLKESKKYRKLSKSKEVTGKIKRGDTDQMFGQSFWHPALLSHSLPTWANRWESDTANSSNLQLSLARLACSPELYSQQWKPTEKRWQLLHWRKC